MINKWIEQYPWLLDRDVWSGELIGNNQTLLENLPVGWLLGFVGDMLAELNETLIEYNIVNKYRIFTIDAYNGEMVWRDNIMDFYEDTILFERLRDWHQYYRILSQQTCIYCGLPTDLSSDQGWEEPICDNCVMKHGKE